MIIARDNAHFGTQAALFQAALSTTVPFADKNSATKAWTNFKGLISGLMGD